MKKIFIWGCYWQGNFGDDLMAVLMARDLQNMGHDVLVFRLPSNIASKYSLKSVNDVETGVAWADVVLLGGGAVLKAALPGWRKIFSASSREIEREIEKLAIELIKKKKALYCCSIGSDGVSSLMQLSPARKKLICETDFRGGSLRLEKDVSMFDVLDNSEVFYSPDILLSSYLKFPVNGYENRESNRVKIGVNVSKRDGLFVRRLVRKLEKFSNMEISFLLTHSKSSGIVSEYASDNVKFQGRPVPVLINDDPVEFLNRLKEFDIVISVKLHLGLVAMMGGATFFSYKGKEKTKSQLASFGLGEYIYDEAEENKMFDAIVAHANDLSLDNKNLFQYLSVETKEQLRMVSYMIENSRMV